jgi:nicotinamide-nucleotide amidase
MNSSLPQQLVDRLRKQNAMICTVESCTGGKVASLITEIAGASDVFWGSWVAYDNLAKRDMLEISEQLISKHGAVSEEVVKALASNALQIMKRSVPKPHQYFSISLSGIAGPTGGTPEKPVGLCFIGFDSHGKSPTSKKIMAPKGLSRLQNIEFFSSQAIQMLLEQFMN